MEAPVIELRKVNKIYPGVHALRDVDFTLYPGEVHCLVGSNGSGKSTMIKIISGVEQPELGSELYIRGEKIHHHSSRLALKKGIQVIYQDMALFPNLSIRENIAFRNHFERGSCFVRRKALDQLARRAMDMIGLRLDLDQSVSALSIAQQQLVEIVRSLSTELSLLILDEPTASLTRKEVNALFAVIEKLRAQGVSILFVSHKLNEVFEVAEQVTILRDGDKIGQFDPEDLDHNRLVHLMTGQEELHEALAPLPERSRPLLELSKLCKKDHYWGIDLSLKPGEILGITGLLGSGRTELALSIFGMKQPDSGEIRFQGKPVRLRNNVDALRLGIGYVPENRKADGLVFEQSIADNISLTTLYQHLNRLKLLDEQSLEQDARSWEKALSIKIPRLDNLIQTLSGGNQQKVVLAKWLALKPKLLILDEPTVGIDVIAKNSIHSLVKTLAASGMGVIIISDEVQEVLHNSHRVLIMNAGRIVDEFLPEQISEQELLKNYNLA